MKLFREFKRLMVAEDGISSVEYALLLALVGVAIAAAATALGTGVSTEMNDATTALGG